MFKIEESTIHCSRGDAATIALKLPYIDLNKYFKYKDVSENIYWYDPENEKLYDSDYDESQVSLDTLTQVFYQFQVGDEILFNVYMKNGYGKDPVLSVKTIVETASDTVEIVLTETDTTFGNPVNKATIFWYDITLNDDTTILGYDNEDGAKKFIEYPAKGEYEE